MAFYPPKLTLPDVMSHVNVNNQQPHTSTKSTMPISRIKLLLSASVLTPLYGFCPISPSNTRNAPQTSLLDVIQGEAIESVALDENLGGVGLAKRCAIKISGTSEKGGSAEADLLENLVRYEKMQSLSEDQGKSMMEKYGCTLVANGMGKELYYFPDDSARYEDKVIKLAPDEAAKDALAKAGEIGDAKHIVLNFLGGDDLIYGEVRDACDFLVQELDVPAGVKITFNSISFTEFEEGTCSVTVLASNGISSFVEGIDESIAKGEAYVYNGKWYTVTKEDITAASD